MKILFTVYFLQFSNKNYFEEYFSTLFENQVRMTTERISSSKRFSHSKFSTILLLYRTFVNVRCNKVY